MIGYINGPIVSSDEDSIIVETNGIGYRLFVLPQLLLRGEGEKVALWTYLAVRENALDLYGFNDKQELSLFERLVGVSGIGPKSALGIVGIAPAETLASAIAAGDTSYLTKVSGIGPKSAQKIVLELKDKLEEIGGYEEHTELRKEESDALDALVALGYSTHQAREALKKLPDEAQTVNEKIRAALTYLGSQDS